MNRLVALALLLWVGAVAGLENRLAGHPSPYLAMHGQDPVHWQPWSNEVLELARKEGKLIFVSSGYYACHWCHVMQRESYADAQIARLLNRHFIPVKVDRELDPALDEHLIDFVQRTSGRAGWPLNVFLTPDGYPVAGLTYAPPDQFKVILERFVALWRERRAEVERLARLALDELQAARRQEATATVVLSDAQLLERFLGAAMTLADELSGGFGQQNRFPMAPQLHTLLWLQRRFPRPEVAEFLTLTLDKMAREGLRDHLGGGFFRYTVDPQWQTPHYEKMLYTQALLALLYLEAAEVLQRPDYRQVAFDTLDFVVADMAGESGGYLASLSAVDDQGREGAHYLWHADELARLLTPEERKLAEARWRLTLEDEGEGRLPRLGTSVAELARAQGLEEKAMAERLDALRAKLLAARRERPLPKDTKVLAGWNGLLLAALARAARTPGGERFADAARALADHLAGRYWQGDRLIRMRQGALETPGTLEDYAYVAWGFQALAALEDDSRPKGKVERILAQAWSRFYDARGWRSSQTPSLPGMPAAVAQEDGALPAPSAVVLRLSLERGGALAAKARQALPGVRSRAQTSPFWYASHLPLLIEAKD